MNLRDMKVKKGQQGFTIVELLIVIIVIAILAAITIVAYNGIQKRANVSATQSGANTLQKKAEAYNAVKSSYPTTLAAFDTVTESSLSGSGLTVLTSGNPNADNGKTTFKYEYCILGSTAPTKTSTATGARITYFDYDTNTVPAAQIKLGDAAGTATYTCSVVSAS